MNNFFRTSIFHSLLLEASSNRFHISVLCKSQEVQVLQKTQFRTQICSLLKYVHETTVREWYRMCTHVVFTLRRFDLRNWFVLGFIMKRITADWLNHPNASSLIGNPFRTETSRCELESKQTKAASPLQDVTPKKIFLFIFTAVRTSDLIKRPRFTTIPNKWQMIFSSVNSIRYRDEGALSSFSDVDRYVIIRKLPDYVYNAPPLLKCRWEIQTHTGLFFRKVAYTRCDTLVRAHVLLLYFVLKSL
jgi:hypothetical protein